MTTQTQERIDFTKRVNYGKAITGWLAHDNKYFDRTCKTCGGMYTSAVVAVCPKCRQTLVPIALKDGRAMGISEGTLYVALSKKQKDKDNASTKNRKGGMIITHRFKLFSFDDGRGLNPHPMHRNMRKGALVEVRIYNHQELTKPYQTKEGEWKIELMYPVYDQYGDKVIVLRGPKIADATTPYRVKTDGTPAPIDTLSNEAIDAAMAALTQERERRAAMTAASVQPAAPVAAPVMAPTVNSASEDDYQPEDLDFGDPDENIPEFGAVNKANATVNPFDPF